MKFFGTNLNKIPNSILLLYTQKPQESEIFQSYQQCTQFFIILKIKKRNRLYTSYMISFRVKFSKNLEKILSL